MLLRNIIRPSKRPYIAPIVLVTNKDGSNRMCVDFRKLNEATRKDAFPLPRIDQIFDHHHGAKICSSLDLASGYWQGPLAESAIPKTALVTREFLWLPFGLCNAPGTSQRLMTAIFNEYFFNFALLFMDDVLVFSKSEEEALRKANLKLKPKKCKLYQNSLTYFGFKLSAEKISPDEGKIRALKERKGPEKITDVRSFIIFCSYYRRFVKDFTGIAKLLH